MSSTQQTGFLDNLVTAARENPLAAALIGGGAFLLLTGNENLKKAASSATAAGSRGICRLSNWIDRFACPMKP